MASTLRLLAVTLLLFTLTTAVVSMEDDELESMLNVLRARGYNLFSNAISTSDIIYEVISGKSFTFFAPTDSSLFTLDMTNTANEYISTLRCHVIPLRVLFPDLRRLPSGSSLPTLVKNHRATIRLENPSSVTSSDGFISINGVRVVLPDLVYSSNIAVHGLRGNLNCTSIQDSAQGNQASSSPRRGNVSSLSQTRNRGHAPSPPSNFSSAIRFNTSANVQNPKAPSPSPASLLDDHDFNSLVVSDSEGQAKPSELDMSDHMLSPSSTDTRNPNLSSPEPEPPVGGGFPPSHSPVKSNLPPQVSPAYDLWLDAPTSTVFPPSTEPGPPPEFSENDDPMAFPPSATESQGDHMLTTGTESSSMNENEIFPIEEDDETKNEFSDRVPVTGTEGMAGIVGKTWEKCEPLDEAIFECTMIDGLGHVGVPDALPAYAYTRQPNFANTRMSCCNA